MKKPTLKLLRQIVKSIGVHRLPFDIRELQKGFMIEAEHGTVNPITNVTNDDPVLTTKIAMAHLFENPNYYKILSQVNL